MNISAANSRDRRKILYVKVSRLVISAGCINGRFIKPFDHLDGTIADDRRPVVQPADDKLNRFPCMAVMGIIIIHGMLENAIQLVFAVTVNVRVEKMKDGKSFFGIEDDEAGQVVLSMSSMISFEKVKR